MIRDKIQSKLGKAFNGKLADAVKDFACQKVVYSGDYNHDLQEYHVAENKSYTGRCIRGSYLKDTVKPIDYQVEDAKAILLQNEVTRIPEIDDIWVFTDGDFKVINISKDPADASFTIQIRKTGQKSYVSGVYPSPSLFPSQTLYPSG
jgi:hypothetical protein